MRPRSDGLHFSEEAVVVADRCVSCGICAGACPSSNPFRGEDNFVSGIEMPSLPMSGLRAAMLDDMAKLRGEARIIVIGCDNAANIERFRSESIAVLSLPCIAMLPPSFIEYALHEHHVDGVFVTGCRVGDCYHRMGVRWSEQRLTAQREPRLRSRADRERIRRFWAASTDSKELEPELASFRTNLLSVKNAH